VAGTYSLTVCGFFYGFLSFVDVFNECLVTASGAASRSTSLDKQAVVLKGGSPKDNVLPTKGLSNWDRL